MRVNEKNQKIYAVDRKNHQIYVKIKKNVRGTSITIYYTYNSPYTLICSFLLQRL